MKPATKTKTNKQPASNIKWIHRDELSPNLYNPNMVAPPELELLRVSILEDGWLFPILVFDKDFHIEGLTDNAKFDKYTIVDGFHRYTVSEDIDIYKMTDGYVPVIVKTPDNPMATTVRMNRAKGTHGVMKMAEIIKREIENETTMEDLMAKFGMEREEILRLSYSQGIHKSKIIGDKGWSNAWIPK